VTYRRPPLNLGIYLDDHGEPISYGNRWGMGHPPEDTYSVTRHPERFAPIVDVAEALREYLIATYDVTEHGDQLVPSDPAAASLTIEVTDFPLARASAGISGFQGAWNCGCDACDDDVEELADTLERFVFAVVNAGFQDEIKGRSVHSSWHDDQGGTGSETPRKVVDKAVFAALKARGRDAVYAPWPTRT